MSDLERVQFFYDNGNIEYVGTVHPVTQQFHGKGVLFAEEGHLLYVGEFAEGDFEGEGTAYFPNGIKFSEGTWVDNKLHGKGKVYDEQGKLGYEGYLKDNRPCARRDVENPEEWAKVEDVKASHKALETLMEELDAFIGLGAVKKEIKSLINLVKVQKIRREHDLPELSISLHMVLTGNPGTGKTTIARQIASILGTLGVLSKGHMVETDRSGLVAGFVGQTGIKVTDIVDEATGGVLFIDEAYALVKDDRDQYGEEAIATLLKLMEDRRDDLVVIMAGYQKEMNAMLQVNPGLASRFNRFIDFPDYNANELLSISDLICKQSGYVLDDNARQFLTKVYNIAISRKKKNFANGRLARNLFERAIIHQSNRIISENANSELALTTIQVEDIKAVLKNKEIQL
ncbi:hypothetical protein KUL152_32580 [Tenacibaculum sp. KUL152]|nr:hypothetical protein KUL152_32580 [Tenacibaculum sp. KUL152]GFD94592.1 hypothetical protein KUL154_33250 [Alteromonas sp. KUL154]GFE01602.1 hypothetical protein KUL156_41940 [Alteromonas sp. KUL156]